MSIAQGGAIPTLAAVVQTKGGIVRTRGGIAQTKGVVIQTLVAIVQTMGKMTMTMQTSAPALGCQVALLTLDGLTQPGATATYKVFVITETDNERGSESLSVTRPSE